MRAARLGLVLLVAAVAAWAAAPGPASSYRWLDACDPAESIAERIAPPATYQRTLTAAGTFEDWLRHLPLKKGTPPIRLFNGQERGGRIGHVAVVDIDVGERDLQQCADAVIRLRAEYLWAAGRRDAIQFHFTSGDRADYTKWLEGFSPEAQGTAVRWVRGKARPDTHASLRSYLDVVFTYAGTRSLAKELRAVASPADMRIGDVFIQAGSPGHAVLVVDMAAHPATGKKVFLLAQSYMPAQDIHVLKNPAGSDAWYDVDFGDVLRTPDWTFKRTDLRRF
jgi:hypothetical protein